MLPFTAIFTAFGLADIGDKFRDRFRPTIENSNPVEIKPFWARMSPVAAGRASYFVPSDQGISEVGYSQKYIQSIDDFQTPAAMVLFQNEFDVYGGSVLDALPIHHRVPRKL